MRHHKLYVIAPILMLLIAGRARAEQRVDEFLAKYDAATEDVKKIHKIYVSGAIEALLYADVTMQLRHNSRLYCQPDKLPVSADLVIDMLRRGSESDPEVARAPIALGIIDVLMATFPCNESSTK